MRGVRYHGFESPTHAPMQRELEIKPYEAAGHMNENILKIFKNLNHFQGHLKNRQFLELDNGFKVHP